MRGWVRRAWPISRRRHILPEYVTHQEVGSFLKVEELQHRLHARTLMGSGDSRHLGHHEEILPSNKGGIGGKGLGHVSQHGADGRGL
jgi:hypothetical protein